VPFEIFRKSEKIRFISNEGGMKTLENVPSAVFRPDEYFPQTEMAILITSRYPTIETKIKEFTLYYEWGNFVFVFMLEWIY